MARTLPPEYEAAIAGRKLAPVTLFELEVFNQTTSLVEYVRTWTGIGTITWLTNDFVGTGTLLSVSVIEETAEIRAASIEITLSNIPPDVLAIALDYHYQGRPITIWQGLLDDNGAFLADPIIVFKGLADTMGIVDGQTGAVRVTAESRLREMNRASGVRYTHQTQIAKFPADLGLEFVESLQDKEISWGRA